MASGLEGSKQMHSHARMVGRSGVVVPPFLCSVRASVDGLSAGVVGFLMWQLRTARVIFLGEEVEADRSM